MRTGWIVIAILAIVVLMFPIADLAYDKNPQLEEEKIEKLEKTVQKLDTEMKKLEERTKETFDYIKEKHKELAQKENASVEIIQILYEEANNYNIPFELAYQIVKLESNFDPKLTCYNEWNDTYDRGLFQLNDNTSPWLAKKVGIKNFNYEMTYNPKLNIKMGLWYLSFLYKKYENWHDALTAYNRGMGGLKKYKRINGTSRSAYSRAILNSLESN